MTNKKIVIIGAGHMGSAIIQGLIAADKENSKYIIATDPSQEKLQTLEKKFHIKTFTKNKEAIELADYVLIAVRPFAVAEVLKDLQSKIQNKLLISVAAGVDLGQLQKNLYDKQKIIRIMPNMPVAYNAGVIGFFANDNISEEEKGECKQLFSVLGKVCETLQEEDLVYFSLIPGCGPALASYCIELFATAGEQFKLDETTRQEVALQIFFGTLLYLQKTKQTPKELQNAVATKGGVTERIIQTLDKKEFGKIFSESVQEGYKKIEEIRRSQEVDK